MNIPTQLLPHKHIRFCESLIGLAGYIRQLLDKPRTIDELYSMLNGSSSAWLYKPTFEQVVSAVVILFTIGQIAETDSNKLYLTDNTLNELIYHKIQQVEHKVNQLNAVQRLLQRDSGSYEAH